MDASLKNVRTVSLVITYTTYHILGRKQTTCLRQDFKHAQLKSITPLIFPLFPIGQLFKSHHSLIESTVNIWNTLFLLAHLRNVDPVSY
jgi:uncharacterized membrane protein